MGSFFNGKYFQWEVFSMGSIFNGKYFQRRKFYFSAAAEAACCAAINSG